jgi:hypothetical protein
VAICHKLPASNNNCLTHPLRCGCLFFGYGQTTFDAVASSLRVDNPALGAIGRDRVQVVTRPRDVNSPIGAHRRGAERTLADLIRP